LILFCNFFFSLPSTLLNQQPNRKIRVDETLKITYQLKKKRQIRRVGEIYFSSLMLVQAWNIKVRQADYSKYQKLFKQNLSCQSSVWEKTS